MAKSSSTDMDKPSFNLQEFSQFQRAEMDQEALIYSEVIQLIQEWCHVKVTKHQLARQICRWNFQKRIKLKELRGMAKVCGLRAFLNTFVVRGRYYTDHEIRRRFKRSRMAENEGGRDLNDVTWFSPEEDTWPQLDSHDSLTRPAEFHLGVSCPGLKNPSLQNVIIRRPLSDIAPINGPLQHRTATGHPITPPIPAGSNLLEPVYDISQINLDVTVPGESNGHQRIVADGLLRPSGSLYTRRRSKGAINTTPAHHPRSIVRVLNKPQLPQAPNLNPGGEHRMRIENILNWDAGRIKNTLFNTTAESRQSRR
jgi:hypothetical protein